MRIGMIAMSGIRVRNEELMRAGLTLPGFVERSQVIASLPSLGLLTLAGCTPERFEVDYQEIDELDEMADLPDNYDLVAISTFTAQIFDAYRVADRFRAKGVPVVMGGLHVTSMPHEALEHCDAVVVGEAEAVWPRLLEDFESGRLKRVYGPVPGEEFDLADAPVPRFDLLDPGRYNRITLQTSRGCPHKCEFCASSILLTPRYKLKPVAKVIEELHAVKRVWRRPFIEFADDNSFVHPNHYKELMRALIPERIRWFTETDIAIARDDELLGLMRDAGCQQILIGLESPRKSSLEGLELKADWKRKRHDEYIEAIRHIQSFGITVNGCFILGMDGDTPGIFDEILDFVRRSGLFDVQITFLTAFPGTPLYRRLQREGRVVEEGRWDLCTLFDINHEPRGMTREELYNGFVRLAEALYSDEETERRRRNFRMRLRLSPNARKQRAG